MTRKPPSCPVCKSTDLHRHCETRTCTWVSCRACGAYGYLQGRFVTRTKEPRSS